MAITASAKSFRAGIEGGRPRPQWAAGCRTPRRRRALLPLPQREVVLDQRVYEYVVGIVRAVAVAELQELVVRTGNLELCRRFLRYASACDRRAMKEAVTLLDVMSS